ncbi:MAG TPA: RNA polymerase sigma factor [Dehalococcoidia bacterium]|nr:RNA polymerase sigma factor [Dehalococcoidia bacterium]
MGIALTEEQAVAGAKRGNPDAFGALVGAHQQVAFRAAWLLLRDSAAAQDIVQEAFIRAYRDFGRFRDGAPFRPWLLRIVTNLALNEVRSRTRRSSAARRFAETANTALVEGPAQGIEAKAQLGRVQAAIAQLPLGDQRLLHLRYFLELPEREIAAAIGKRPGTVKSRLHRASRRLRDVIEARFPDLLEDRND